MNKQYKKGEYGFDKEILNAHLSPVELMNEQSRILIAPEYQGRVMTSSSNGDEGFSYGWINHELIKKGEIQQHINAYGGEERFWLGPEGGQFSIFFKPGSNFNMTHWQTPKCIDTESFDIVSRDEQSVLFQKNIELTNYSGTRFSVQVQRQVKILCKNELASSFDIQIPKEIRVVGYQTKNNLRNVGKNEWTTESGTLSIWMLGMMNPSPEVTVIIPFNPDAEGEKVNSNYFGTVPSDRLHVGENVVFFKADGKYRSKIGISPARALPVLGSYDDTNHILTILRCNIDKEAREYVNSAWEIQKKPFGGDVINSYNDGPLDDGNQMGPFYELETSSKAAFLKPEQELLHVQETIHFEGSEQELDKLSKRILNVSIQEIRQAFTS